MEILDFLTGESLEVHGNQPLEIDSIDIMAVDVRRPHTGRDTYLIIKVYISDAHLVRLARTIGFSSGNKGFVVMCLEEYACRRIYVIS
jgi:hypothetical protein